MLDEQRKPKRYTILTNGEFFEMYSRRVTDRELKPGWFILVSGVSEEQANAIIPRYAAKMETLHNPRRRKNPFKRRRPAEWEHMTRAQRSKWNKENWTPDQYVADKGLARDDRRIAKRHLAAKVVQDRGVGYVALARALGLDADGEAIDRGNPRRRSRGHVSKLRHLVVPGRKRSRSRRRR
jgi:hypothetical protein